MLRNYLTVALRYLRKNKAHSFINIAGLSVGMAVAMLIGLWIWDEMTYDRFPEHYDKIAQVMQSRTFNGEIKTGKIIPVPLADELRKSYGDDFRYIVLSSWNWNHILTVGEKSLTQAGSFMGPDVANLFTLTMLKGSRSGLNDPSSLLPWWVFAGAGALLITLLTVSYQSIKAALANPVKSLKME